MDWLGSNCHSADCLLLAAASGIALALTGVVYMALNAI